MPWACYKEVRGNLIKVAITLDHVLHGLISWQCCYSGLYWTSKSFSLLSTLGWDPHVAHKAAAVEQNVWRWGACVCPARSLEVCLCTCSGLASWTECSFVAGTRAVFRLCIVPSGTAPKDPSCVHRGVWCELSDEQDRSGDLPRTHIPDPDWNGNVDTHEALHSLCLPPAAVW